MFQTHLTFGREFTEAVEMKQVAQQEAERARYVVERVRTIFIITSCSIWLCANINFVAFNTTQIHEIMSFEQEEQRKRAAVTRAEGDSKAAELIAKALSGKFHFIAQFLLTRLESAISSILG